MARISTLIPPDASPPEAPRDASGGSLSFRQRLERIDWPPLALAFVALLWLVWLGRDMTFYHDEWALILKRDLSINGIFAPHNEHLSATLVVLYRVLIGTVGLGSYWP